MVCGLAEGRRKGGGGATFTKTFTNTAESTPEKPCILAVFIHGQHFWERFRFSGGGAAEGRRRGGEAAKPTSAGGGYIFGVENLFRVVS